MTAEPTHKPWTSLPSIVRPAAKCRGIIVVDSNILFDLDHDVDNAHEPLEDGGATASKSPHTHHTNINRYTEFLHTLTELGFTVLIPGRVCMETTHMLPDGKNMPEHFFATEKQSIERLKTTSLKNFLKGITNHPRSDIKIIQPDAYEVNNYRDPLAQYGEETVLTPLIQSLGEIAQYCADKRRPEDKGPPLSFVNHENLGEMEGLYLMLRLSREPEFLSSLNLEGVTQETPIIFLSNDFLQDRGADDERGALHMFKPIKALLNASPRFRSLNLEGLLRALDKKGVLAENGINTPFDELTVQLQAQTFAKKHEVDFSKAAAIERARREDTLKNNLKSTLHLPKNIWANADVLEEFKHLKPEHLAQDHLTFDPHCANDYGFEKLVAESIAESRSARIEAIRAEREMNATRGSLEFPFGDTRDYRPNDKKPAFFFP